LLRSHERSHTSCVAFQPEFLLQFPDAFDEGGEATEFGGLAHATDGKLRGGAPPFLAVGDVMHDAGMTADGDLVADLYVARKGSVPGDDCVITNLHAPRNSALGDDDAVLANLNVMTNLNEVINLGAFADERGTECAAVNSYHRANLDIVANDDVANLRDFAVLAFVHDVTESVRADDTARVDADAFANLGAGIESDIRKKVYVLGQLATRADVVTALQDGVTSNLDALADNAVRPDVGRGIDFCRGSNHRTRMDAGGQSWFRKEKPHDPGKGHARVFDSDEYLARSGGMAVGDDGGCPTLFGAGEIFLVLRKSQVALPGGFRRGESFQRNLRISNNFPLKLGSDFGGGKRHIRGKTSRPLT